MKRVLIFAVLFTSAVCLAQTPNNLTVHLVQYCPNNYNVCHVHPYEGGQFGTPADGVVNFSPIMQPWFVSFMTATPTQWTLHNNFYNATFGVGGTVQVNGPDGKTMTGMVTSGTSYDDLNSYSWGATINFSGVWSDRSVATGVLIEQYSDQNGKYVADFTINTVSPTQN